jgi:anaphase-promoting complex subunit 6
LEDHQYDMDILAIYIVCLSELDKNIVLFTLAHKLVDLFPKKRISWFAVATYYFTIARSTTDPERITICYNEARRYFTKSTSLDTGFGQAWIGYGHSYALEGEHDQAVSIYSTACKYLPG